jgi:hypothetical protein
VPDTGRAGGTRSRPDQPGRSGSEGSAGCAGRWR